MTASLREKKRRQVQSTIEHAALELMTELDYDTVTVAQICEAAGVSRRTFFNYFGSKEAVVLGPTPEPPSDALVQEFLDSSSPDVLGDLVRMMTTTLLEKQPDHDLGARKRRAAVIHRNPELARMHIERIAAANQNLVALVARRLRTQQERPTGAPPPGTGDDEGLESHAAFVVSLWMGIALYAARLWTTRPQLTVHELHQNLFDHLDFIKETQR
ncbi:TetR/AcrR family transcriptional regulator [Brachybacterium huguangmaarense]|uniref:TetR/AcrR family transcriptional regulator n=1 Tax=Brachybacterium huguangmaarense TaxID=1652028 RepID=A0ABY6G375_9MICO|nr:TetR/AcrR family transcriptional regulator [Brachybacterium huguangmaarense]UYG17661.1 TetR/AcrR family transcriptional regulator [Brachybacterium huguangmaarense]